MEDTVENASVGDTNDTPEPVNLGIVPTAVAATTAAAAAVGVGVSVGVALTGDGDKPSLQLKSDKSPLGRVPKLER